MNRPPQIVVALLAMTLLLSVDQSIAENASDQPPGEPVLTPSEQAESPIDPSSEAQRQAKRRRMAMVARQLRGRDIKNPAVLAAMGKVQRHRFLPEKLRIHAYDDRPLPIGHRQTISQPYIVALMTQLAKPTKAARALDVGTGSGYQAAVLAELVESVYSIEIVQPLATSAKATLKSLGYRNIHVRHGDGYRGWKEHAPFDLIIVAAAPDHVPEPLIQQLAVDGKLVIPIGTRFGQQLIVLTKEADGRIDRKVVAPVAFVPMTGELVDQK